MKFGTPLWLWLMPLLVALALVWLWWSQRRRRLALASALPTPLLDQLVAGLDPRRRWVKHGLLVFGVAVLALALARPQHGHESVQVERTGIDLLVALDVSRSMLVADVEGTNRLAAARAALRNLLRHLGGDRVGLVAFAGEAFLVVPLTRDHAVVERALSSLQPDMISEPGTDVARAIRRAQESFDRGSEGPRALLVISDGEAVQGEAAAAAHEAGRDRIRVHTAGVGSHAGGRVPVRASPGSGYLKNAFGREVVSRLDERKLRESAQSGQGLYARLAGRDSHELVAWFERAAAGLPRTTEIRQLGDPREFYQWPLLAALILLAFEWSFHERRRGRATSLLIASFLLSLPAGAADQPLPAGGPRSGVAAATDGDAKADPWTEYNRGVIAYAAGGFQLADDTWLELAHQSLPRRLQPAVWFQIGNAEFRLGEPLEQSAPEQALEHWRRSRDGYRTGLRINRRHAAAQHNLALVEQRLAKLNQRLGQDLHRRSESEAPDRAIDLLRAAVDHLREAVELAPTDPTIRRDDAAADLRLRERLLERARQAENRGDEAAKPNNPWSDAQAEQAYRDALADLVEAQSPLPSPGTPASTEPPPPPSEARDGPPAPVGAREQARAAAERVERKLSELLTRMGQREQRSGEADTPNNPEAALDHFDEALQHYAAAREVDPANAAARRGEDEVRAAMERLYVQEGKRSLARGIEATPQNVPVAARELTAALSHFDAALEFNARNAEAAEGAAEARRRLPDVLARLGRSQQDQAERAEAESAATALPFYEEAETSYRDALTLEAQHAPAQKGLAQVEERMASLRRQLQQAAQQANGKAPSTARASRSLDQLLGEVQDPRRDRLREEERQRQAGRNDARPRKAYPDW